MLVLVLTAPSNVSKILQELALQPVRSHHLYTASLRCQCTQLVFVQYIRLSPTTSRSLILLTCLHRSSDFYQIQSVHLPAAPHMSSCSAPSARPACALDQPFASTSAPKLVVGCALLPKKIRRYLTENFLRLARGRNLDVRIIDRSKPLEGQGPFHVILHKVGPFARTAF